MSELDDAIAAVSAEAEKEYKGEVTPGSAEVKPEAAPAAEEKPPAEKDVSAESGQPSKPDTERDEHGRFLPKKGEEEEEEEEPLGLSAEELAAINADEKLVKAYKSMQRGLTKKTMTLAEQRKQLESRAAIADWIQQDPDSALRAIAAARGVKLAEDGATKHEATKEVVDALETEWSKAFGDEGKPAIAVLRPLFEKTAENVIRKVFESEIAPLKEQVEQHTNAATARGILAAKEEFVAKVKGDGSDWDETIEKEMAEVVKRMEPGKHEDGSDVTIDEFLQDVYDSVMYRRMKSSARREELKRLRTARETAEPVNPIRPAKTTPAAVTLDMSDKDAIELAIALSTKEAGGR